MLRRLALLALRLACVLSLTLWANGLTFYGLIVLPRMHDVFGRRDSALVTREVSHVLNLLGVLALALWWTDTLLERRHSPRWLHRATVLFLAVSTLILLWLFPQHALLARLVDSAAVSTPAFYAHHRDYLVGASVQWASNLLLLASGLAAWSQTCDRPPSC